MIGSICKDANSKDFQWFYFLVENIEQKPLKIRIKGILQSSYPTAWQSMKTVQQKNIWIIGRQHPGETIVGWFMDALAEIFVLHPHFLDPLFQLYQFFIVPMLTLTALLWECIALIAKALIPTAIGWNHRWLIVRRFVVYLM